ncbi:MAG TPA: PAS domain-containing protein [Victivallales bacterium]|nr:PAS domain-containing protein [Victivallales bacterium]
MSLKYSFNYRKFKTLRKSLKLSQKNIADYIGKASSRTIIRWEKGENKPTESEIRYLSEILNVSVSEISDLEESKNINLPYYYDELSNLDKSTYDLSTKTDSEKQKLLIDIIRQNKILTWQNHEKHKAFSDAIMIVNSLNYLVYKKTIELKYTFANNYFLSYFGFDGINQVQGQRNSDIWKNKKNWNEITILEKKVFDTGIPVKNQLINIPRTFGLNGSGIVNIIPLYNDDGQIKEIVCSIKDISGEQALNEKYFYMESALEKLEHVIWIIKLEPYRHFLYINNAIEKIYAAGKNEFFKNADFWLDFIHKDDIKRVKNELSDRKEEFIYRIVVNNSEIRWIRHFLYRAEVQGSKIEFGVIKDITKNMNDEKLRLMMETSINSMKETFGITDPNSVESLYFSKSRAEIYGYPMSKLVKGGHDFWLNKCVHPDDYQEQKQYTENDSWPKMRRFRIIRGDGKVRWLETRRITITFYGHKYLGYFESDITGRIGKEEEQRVKEGRAYSKGYRKAQLKMAKTLKDMGVSTNLLTEACELSVLEINEL